MSPRAAWRLESLGFSKVYEYVEGKADWAVAGLPREGGKAGFNRAIDVVRRDVPTCRLNVLLKDAGGRIQVGGKDMCLVVNDEGILLGRLRGAVFERDPETPIEEIMESGPTTIRPDTMLQDICERMEKRRVDSVLVATETGHLIGILYRADAEWALGEAEPE
ncbi:MAG: CBS domain-containing protein [Chloroflexi bacterium]|nr:CBS domain-containing protein [Chloroflexota bacterium]